MKTISLCMIVKDEEKVLERCLNSVKDIVDEIIIVDTGSKDNTVNIAKKYTHKIYEIKWEKDFSKARNYSFSKASKDYILWLDADDYIEEESINRFIELKQSLDGSIDMFYFLYNFNKNYLPFYRERLLKKDKNYRFVGKIHEVISPSGNIAYKDIVITQQYKENKKIDRNLKIYESIDKSLFSKRDYYYYAKELYRNKRYTKSIKMFKEFLSFDDIYLEDRIDSFYTLGNIYFIKKEYYSALKTYFLSFAYDKIRNNILVEIANVFYTLGKYDLAIFYYELSLKNINANNNRGFIEKKYFDYYPYIGLSLCYYKLDELDKSLSYLNLAYQNYEKDNLYFYNKKVIENKIK